MLTFSIPQICTTQTESCGDVNIHVEFNPGRITSGYVAGRPWLLVKGNVRLRTSSGKWINEAWETAANNRYIKAVREAINFFSETEWDLVFNLDNDLVIEPEVIEDNCEEPITIQSSNTPVVEYVTEKNNNYRVLVHYGATDNTYEFTVSHKHYIKFFDEVCDINYCDERNYKQYVSNLEKMFANYDAEVDARAVCV